MSKFGWSYPAGCSDPPEPDLPCAVCGVEAGACQCPECPKCGVAGDPNCYESNDHLQVNGPEWWRAALLLYEALDELMQSSQPRVGCSEDWNSAMGKAAAAQDGWDTLMADKQEEIRG